MINDHVHDLMRWFERMVEREEKALETRRVIAAEQRRMQKKMPVRVNEPIRKTPAVLTPAGGRTLIRETP